MGVAAGHHLAEDDHQVVQPHDRVARLAGDDAVLSSHGPVAGRSGHHQVARLGIDEYVLDPPQTGEILHRFIDALAEGRVELDLLLQPGERDHPQGRTPPHVVLPRLLPTIGTQGGQVARAGFFHQGTQDAAGIDPNAGGKWRDRAGAAVVGPGLGRHGVGDQIDQRLEVRLAVAVCTSNTTANSTPDADTRQDMGPQAIVADAGHGLHGRRRGPGLDLGRGHLGEHGVPLLGIGRQLSGSDGRGELARSQLGLKTGIRLIAPGCRGHWPREAKSPQEHQDSPQSTSVCSGS